MACQPGAAMRNELQWMSGHARTEGFRHEEIVPSVATVKYERAETPRITTSTSYLPGVSGMGTEPVKPAGATP